MGLEDSIVESLDNLKIDPSSALDARDPSFVVEPEFRPKTKHNEFVEALEDQIPVIDLSAIHEKDDPEGLKTVVYEIGKAAADWGFFQVVNHGVPVSLIDTLEQEATAFFSLPVEEKNKSVRSLEKPLGYYHQELTKNCRDWKEVFDFITRESVSFPSSDGAHTYILKSQWPDKPAGLRDACERYAEAVEKLGFQLLGLLSQSLGLPAEHFLTYFTNHTASIRLNYYPPCPIPNLALGVSRHRDPGALTVLVQDEIGGLQVRRKDGEWIGVKPRRDAFVINVGDIFQVWSNDKFHSIEHQVVVNENRARLSFPLFLNPDFTAGVAPVPELLDENHPPRYAEYNYGYFIRKRTDGNYKQDGKNIQIDDFAINRD
ncbi:unnamed protein product [Calypogeia fissa]